MWQSDHVEQHIENLVELGLRNEETLGLIRAHCRHARVETVGGVGMVEAGTGLPIGRRTVRCQHAANAAPMATDLELVAVEFYEANCVGCPHRSPVTVPNLATMVAELKRQEEAREAREQRRREAVAAARSRRQSSRQQRRPGAPQVMQRVLDLLSDYDADRSNRDAGHRLVELARATPEVFDEGVAGEIGTVAGELRNGLMFEALRQLVREGTADQAQAVAIALDVLAESAVTEAALLIAENPSQLDEDRLGPVLRTLLFLAGRPSRLGYDESPEPAPFLVASGVDLPGALDAIRAELQSPDELLRAAAAGAAEVLMEAKPETVQVLTRPLMEALDAGGADPMHDVSAPAAIEGALGEALRSAPQTANAVIESLAVQLNETGRVRAFAAYWRVFSRFTRDPSPEVAALTVQALLRRATGDWGKEVASRAARELSDLASTQPQLLASHVDALLGLLISAAAETDAAADPILAQVASPLAGLERLEARNRHAAFVRDVRNALERVVRAAPISVFERVATLLETEDIGEEGPAAVREEAVRMLGALASDPELLPDVVPYLKRALLDESQVIRARAIEAWTDAAEHWEDKLDAALGDLLPALLRDTYVIVNRALLRGLGRRIRIRPAFRREAAGLLMQWASYYVSQNDAHTLDTLFGPLRRVARRLEREDRQTADAFSMAVAEKLSDYDLRDVLIAYRADLEHHPRYAHLLLRALSSAELRKLGGERYDQLFRILLDIEPVVLAGQVDEIVSTAKRYMPDLRDTLNFVEVLQLADAWEAATELAAYVVDSIPDTAELRAEHALAKGLHAAASIEAAIRRGELDVAETEAENWGEANTIYLEEIDRHRGRRIW